MDFRETLDSILKEGIKSKHLNMFACYCIKFAITCFNNSRFKSELLTYMDHSPEDIATDLIGDLFRTNGGKFIHLEKFFSGTDIPNSESDYLKAKLNSILYNTINQRITKIRIEFGVNYFNVEKSVNENIKRNPDKYKINIINGKKHVYTCEEHKIIINKNSSTEEMILFELFGKKIKTASVPEIMEHIFLILINQDEYDNIVELNYLITIITNFYNRRLI